MSTPRIWIKSSFSSDSANCVEISWAASSKCSVGDCVQVHRGSDVVYVRDSKLGDDSPVQRWELGEWRDLLRLIKWEWTPDGVSRLADGCVEFGLERHDKLTFTGDEWKAFCKGVIAEEFEIDKLREFRSTQTAATGAVGVDAPGSTVPVAAQSFDAMLADPHEQFDPRGELLKSVVEYANAQPLAASAPVAAPLNVPAGRTGEDTPPVSPGLPAVNGQPGPLDDDIDLPEVPDHRPDVKGLTPIETQHITAKCRHNQSTMLAFHYAKEALWEIYEAQVKRRPDATVSLAVYVTDPLVPAVETQETVS